MAQEALGKWLSAGIRGRIAGANELDPLQSDPRLVRGAVETLTFHQLPNKGYHPLSTCQRITKLKMDFRREKSKYTRKFHSKYDSK